MSFIWPSMLLTLLLVPLVVGLYLRLSVRRRQAVAGAGSLAVAQSGTGAAPGFRRHLPALVYLAGLTLLLLALARPELLVSLPRAEGTVILAFDVSNSMAADDLEPTRIDAAKAAARQFIESQPLSVLVGVVAFSNGGLVVQPPTTDRAALLDTVERLSPQGGTSLGQGIFTSLNAIAGEAISIDESDLEEGLSSLQIGNYPSAVIVLLSDGENTGPPDPLEIAQVAAEAGVRIYPIGIGSAAGSVVEVEGFNILTQLDEATLQQIAGLTNGAYYHAEDAESLEEVYGDVDLRLTIRGEKMEATSLFASASLFLFLVGGALALSWFGRVP